MRSTIILLLCASFAACADDEGIDIGGTYQVNSWKAPEFAGQQPCDGPVVERMNKDDVAVIEMDTFGPDVSTCSQDQSDCFPIIFLPLDTPTETGWKGSIAFAQGESAPCPLSLTTASVTVAADGSLTIRRQERYQPDSSDCSVEAAEAIGNSNNCLENDIIVTGPPQ